MRQQFGPFVYRFRTAAPQAAKAGSIPARVIRMYMTKWWNWQTRDAQNVVPTRAWEFDSPLGHLKQQFESHVNHAMTQVGQCPVESHKLHRRVRHPDLQLIERRRYQNGRVRKPAKRRGREPRDFVGSTPTSVTSRSRGPTARRLVDNRKRWFDSIRDHLTWSVGVSAARLLVRRKSRVQFPDGPRDSIRLPSKQEDRGFDSRRSTKCGSSILEGPLKTEGSRIRLAGPLC